MTKPLPKFDAPPVIETVLSAQFARLQQFSNAHAGWFWKGCLGKEWTHVQSAPRLNDQFERFGDEIRWGPPAGIRIVPGTEPGRLQILRDDDERMIQIQDSRFVYNWRKQKAAYPSYEKVLSEFQREFAKFDAFVKEAELGVLELNQWEVTYVNHIEKGSLWSTFDDWKNIFPSLSSLGNLESELSADSFRGEWRFVVGKNLGRLYVSMSQGKIGSEEGPEVIRLQLTVRGAVNKEIDIWGGFNMGHETIVRYFAAVTSDAAHEYWKRRA